MKPYGVISDTHNHGWNLFSTTLPSGVNNRLDQILSETARAAEEVRKLGGHTLYHGGDLFHVRGSIQPSVLNPTMDCYRKIIKSGIQIVINAGNHDLEGKEATRIGSAITALEDIGCRVVNRPTYNASDDVAMIPWIANVDELKAAIEAIDPSDRPGCDLILHAPIDGVIPGLPDHGLTDAYLAALGFRRVFSGHYHNHKDFGNGVYSIGALTHQTWGDVGSKAGFLIVHEKEVRWHSTHAPQFVAIDNTTPPEEIPLIVDGNYVKVSINSGKQSDVETMRQFLLDANAAGVIVIAEKAGSTVVRIGSTFKAGTTVEASVGDYVDTAGFKNVPALTLLCQEILASVKAVR